MIFTEDNIIKLFGNEAAEDENIDLLKNYYFKGDTYSQLKSSNSFYIVVGHKGTGKSAILKMLAFDENSVGNFAVELSKSDVFSTEDDEFLLMIQNCKERIIQAVFSKIIEKVKERNNFANSAFTNWLSRFSEDLKNTIGKSYSEIKNTIPTITYNNFCLLSKTNSIAQHPILICIDDIDLGWIDTEKERKRISAMINAIREINRDVKNVRFRVAMRSSVYYSVRTSDESTDKFESSVIWLTWSNDEIFQMLVKRIMSFENVYDEKKIKNKRQNELVQYIDNVFEATFNGRGHWEKAPIYRVLMSLIRKRPRDLIKLCTMAARSAAQKNHKLIMTSDFESIFVEYSHGRLQDTINEYNTELKGLNEFLLRMKPNVKDGKNSCIYQPDELFKKLQYIIDQTMTKQFANGKPLSPRALATFLYKINFITARKEHNMGIQRLYFEEHNYAINEYADFGYKMEIHPAYRWALQPMSTNNDFYAQISLSID